MNTKPQPFSPRRPLPASGPSEVDTLLPDAWLQFLMSLYPLHSGYALEAILQGWLLEAQDNDKEKYGPAVEHLLKNLGGRIPIDAFRVCLMQYIMLAMRGHQSALVNWLRTKRGHEMLHDGSWLENELPKL